MLRSSERRRRGRTIAVLVAALVTLGASTSVAQAAPSAHSRLTVVAKKHPDRKVEVIAQFASGTSERRAHALVRAHHGRVTDRLSAIHGLVIRLPAREARALRASKRVLDVTVNARVHSTAVSGGRLATTYPKTVGADKLWAAGITGKGVGVAVIDSGIGLGIPDFKGADGNSRIRARVVVPSGTTRSGDDVGHGTHVAGILAGNSFNRPVADPAYGDYVGIAPEAGLIALKVADDDGGATMVDVITALQYVVNNKKRLGIGVVNLSLSSDTPAPYLNDPIDAAVEYAWHSGIVVVVAAGNRGSCGRRGLLPAGQRPLRDLRRRHRRGRHG